MYTLRSNMYECMGRAPFYVAPHLDGPRHMLLGFLGGLRVYIYNSIYHDAVIIIRPPM